MLVLGSGEFTYAPFLLAEELERQGIDVRMQATSRSPVRLGGAIRTITRLQDNYGEGVQHFLYNLRPSQQLILCCETPAAWVDGEFVRYTGASVVSFG